MVIDIAIKVPEPIIEFSKKHPELAGFIKDMAYSLAIVAVFATILYAYAGVWPPLVSVNGLSMHPNMDNGDLVIVQGLNRADVNTYEESVSTGYKMYNNFGDVIVYKPYGDPAKHLVIHRAIRWVNKSEPMPGGVPAPGSGYITLGDNNNGWYDQITGVCYNEPVRNEWIIGIAKFKIPYLGYIRSLF
jgi:signal peptidase